MTTPTPARAAYLKYVGGINDASAKAIMDAFEARLREGATQITLLASSSGGNVLAGITLYNFLRGIPAEVTIHNIGAMNSVAAAVFCAGKRRLSVPHAVFLIHGVTANFPQGAALEEKQLEERLKAMRVDAENLAGIIAANTSRSEDEVLADMSERIALNPEQALAYGLIDEIREDLFPASAVLTTITV